MPLLNPITHTATAWALLAYYGVFFCLGFVWRSWATYRSTGINPIVLPRDDSAAAYLGLAFKLVMAALWVELVLQALGAHPLPGLLWNAPGWLRLLAWGGLAAALLWLTVAQYQMGASWRIGIDVQHATSLVSQGLFGISRNPIFLAMRCAMACTLLLQPSAFMLTLTVAAELLVQIQVRLEESHLLQHHGDSYKIYAQRVARWL